MIQNIYTQCVEETNSDRLIATYNVPAIVKGEADKALAAGILTRAITLANEGKKIEIYLLNFTFKMKDTIIK